MSAAARAVVRRHVLRVHVPASIAGIPSTGGGGMMTSSSSSSSSLLPSHAGAVAVLDAHRVFRLPDIPGVDDTFRGKRDDASSAVPQAPQQPPMHLASLVWVASPSINQPYPLGDPNAPSSPPGFFTALFRQHLVNAIPGLEVLVLSTSKMRVYGADGRQLPREHMGASIDFALSAIARQEMRRPRKVLKTGQRVSGANNNQRKEHFEQMERARSLRAQVAEYAEENGEEMALDDPNEAKLLRPERRALDAPMLRPVVVGGYGYLGSQQATRAMLSAPDRLAGCVLASGFSGADAIDRVVTEMAPRVGSQDVATEIVEGNLNTPFLVMLGKDDPRISLAAAEKGFFEGIGRWNPNAHFRLTNGRGEFALPELRILSGWLGQILGSESATLSRPLPSLSVHEHAALAGKGSKGSSYIPFERNAYTAAKLNDAAALGRHWGFFSKSDGSFMTRATRDALRASTGYSARSVHRTMAKEHLGQ